MIKNIPIKFKGSNGIKDVSFNVPNICPHCGMKMNPEVVGTNTNSSAFAINGSIALFLQCIDSDCKKYFAYEYNFLGSAMDKIKTEDAPIPYTYMPDIEDGLPSSITNISSTFKVSYNQSLKAEQLGLDQIAGVGFRKSLEFLIKDYAIKQNPDNEEKIKKDFLGKVIGESLNDFPKLQKLAKAANWIGTDATHFVQKFSNSDIDSMKRFILAASTFIAADYEADIAEQFIDDNS